MQQLAPSPAVGLIPFGHVSLWDMINFSLYSFMWALRLIRQETINAGDRATANPSARMEGADLIRFRSVFETSIAPVLTQLNISEGRVGTIFTIARLGGPYSQLAHELMALDSDIYHAAETERFYHYRKDDGLLVLTLAACWPKTLVQFKSAKEDVEAGVDCFALDHHTASVFHMMRVAEHGLRALSRELGVTLKTGPIEWATWQELIDAIRAKARDKANALPKGPKRDAVRDFYSGAIGEFEAFKDEFRNHVMHTRKSYERGAAQDAMNHVRSFMERLSDKTDEKGKRIRWR